MFCWVGFFLSIPSVLRVLYFSVPSFPIPFPKLLDMPYLCFGLFQLFFSLKVGGGWLKPRSLMIFISTLFKPHLLLPSPSTSEYLLKGFALIANTKQVGDLLSLSEPPYSLQLEMSPWPKLSVPDFQKFRMDTQEFLFPYNIFVLRKISKT